MLEQYRVPFEAEFKGQSDVAVYELSLVDKLFYRIMSSWIERNLKKTVPIQRQVISPYITIHYCDVFFCFFFTIEVLSVLYREGGSEGQGGDWGHRTEEPYRRPRLPSGWQGIHPLEGNSSAHPKRTADYDKMH